MTAYARIESGVVMEIFTPPTGKTIHDCFAVGLSWVTAPDGVGQGWLWDGANFTAPSPPAVDLRQPARLALEASDTTVVRCYSAGVTVPSEWQSYRVALRAIVAGGEASALPTRPDYPAGT